MTKKNASDSWINFDFTMVHDVDPKELRLNVYGTNESEINLGSDFSTLIARSSISASSSSTSGFAQAMQKGYEYASSTQSFLDAISNLQNKIGTTSSSSAASITTNNNSFPISQPSQNIQAEFKAASGVITIVSAAVGVVKSVIGLVKSFSGGKKSSTATQTTIQYSGIVNTTGTANISNNLYSIQFHQNSQAPLIANRYTPLYSGKIGILGATDQFYLNAWDFWYPECNSQHHKKELYFFNFNSKFIYDQLISGIYDNSNLNQRISVQTYQAYLVNNTIAEKGYQTVSDAPDYNTYRKYNLFKFLEYTPESVNNGVGFNTVHTTPKSLFHTLDNDEVRIEFGSYYFGYGAGDWSKTWFIKNEKFNYPKIAIEIHYKIIDPNYPLEDSRERVIYKVIEPILDYKQFYTSPRTGCPVM
ncbi:hypothetical protein [Sphingobacterium sp. xlx-130]|uniref:hypothetical protein n=1 Tax=Sphingobacterium sp. xlx-130 TaxID=2654323 RepID=UPI0013DC1373|nr:hypothetical protein [Sphingobacterium sp. xlx-130]